MGVFRSVAGQIQIEITGADIPFIFKRLTRAGIVLYNAAQIDDLTVKASIVRKNLPIVKSVVTTCGGDVKIVHKEGLVFTAKKVFKRPILIFTIALLIFMSIYIPSRIFFVKVEGNNSLEAMYIAEKANKCGLCFGASREQVRSEKIKNELIQLVPELDWVGINTYGCVAVIHVKEKEIPNQGENKGGVTSIVASRDGIIENITALKGVALCKPGQAVTKGQTLISGYEDCGIVLKATTAEGEITARTLRQIEILSPVRSVQRTEVTHVEQKYSIIIGKKQINLYKDSGISDASCVKMYSDYYLTLPGDFILPVGISIQTVYHYEIIDEPSQQQDQSFVAQYAKELIIEQMVAGSIIHEKTHIQYTDDLTILKGSYSCLEMIGQVKNEELFYGEDS